MFKKNKVVLQNHLVLLKYNFVYKYNIPKYNTKNAESSKRLSVFFMAEAVGFEPTSP